MCRFTQHLCDQQATVPTQDQNVKARDSPLPVGLQPAGLEPSGGEGPSRMVFRKPRTITSCSEAAGSCSACWLYELVSGGSRRHSASPLPATPPTPRPASVTLRVPVGWTCCLLCPCGRLGRIFSQPTRVGPPASEAHQRLRPKPSSHFGHNLSTHLLSFTFCLEPSTGSFMSHLHD